MTINTNIKTAFLNAYSEVCKLHNYITTNNTDLKAIANMIGDCHKKAKAFNQEVSKAKNLDVPEFVDLFKGELYKIYDILVGTIGRLYIHKSLVISTRQCNDVFFKPLLISNPKLKFAHLPTQLCEAFCKGITYFTHDEPFTERPFYHHERSCGTKSLTAQQKFKNDSSKRFLEVCYIDRLIYDAIYLNTLHIQDVQHKYELTANIARMYQEQFNGASISVRLTYLDQIYPIAVTVIYEKLQGTIVEKYTKSIKNKYVHCIREEKSKTYEKVQSFDQESAWMIK